MSPLHHLNPQATTPQHLPAQPFAPSGAQHPDPYCQQGRPWPAEPGVTAPTIQKQDITLREATWMRLQGFLPPSRLQCEQGHPRTGGGEHRAPSATGSYFSRWQTDQLLTVSPSLKSNLSKPKSPIYPRGGVPAGQHAPPGANGAGAVSDKVLPALPSPRPGSQHWAGAGAAIAGLSRNPFNNPSHGAKFVCKGSS